jgi:hypothetical protein
LEDNIKTNLKETYMRVWTGFIWLRIASSGVLFEYGNGPLRFVKCEVFLDQLNSLELFEEAPAGWRWYINEATAFCISSHHCNLTVVCV